MLVLYFLALEPAMLVVKSFAQNNGLHMFALFQGCLKTSISLPTTLATRSVWVSLEVVNLGNNYRFF